MGASVTFQNLTGARARVQRLTEGLKTAASGAVLDEAAAEIAARIDKVQDAFLARHERTGNARNEAGAAATGALVSARRTRYTKYIPGDPFRRGSFPPFILKAAALILARKLIAALNGERSSVSAEAEGIIADAASQEKIAAIRKAGAEARKALRASTRKLGRSRKKVENG